jgi:hypothetical protein
VEPDQFQALQAAIESTGQTDALAKAALVATVLAMVATAVLAACAVLALVYAKGQLDEIVKANRDAARTEKARFLFNLDEMFENTHFSGSRVALYQHVEAMRAEVRAQFPNAKHDEQNKRMMDLSSKALFKLMHEDSTRYTEIMKVCGFFETLEILIKNGFIDPEHVIDLYGPAIISAGDACCDHIAKRREMNPIGDRALYENFDKLIQRVRPAAG